MRGEAGKKGFGMFGHGKGLNKKKGENETKKWLHGKWPRY